MPEVQVRVQMQDQTEGSLQTSEEGLKEPMEGDLKAWMVQQRKIPCKDRECMAIEETWLRME